MRASWIGFGLAICVLGGGASAAEGPDSLECVYSIIEKSDIPLIFAGDQQHSEAQEQAIRKGKLALAECRRLHSWSEQQALASANYAWGRYNYDQATERLRFLKQDPLILDTWAAGLSEADVARILGGDTAALGARMSSWFQSTDLAPRFTAQQSREFGQVLGRGLAGLLLMRQVKARFDAN